MRKDTQDAIIKQCKNRDLSVIISKKSQFKGNLISIWTQKHNEIIVTNSYYNDRITQTYFIDTNKLITEYYTSSKYTKWLNKLLQSNSIYIKMKDMECYFQPFGYSLKCEIIKNGLNFSGNIENINKFKELKTILSYVKNIIKRIDKSGATTVTVLNEIAYQVEIGSAPVYHIEYDKLIELDRRMSDHSE